MILLCYYPLIIYYLACVHSSPSPSVKYLDLKNFLIQFHFQIISFFSKDFKILKMIVMRLLHLF